MTMPSRLYNGLQRLNYEWLGPQTLGSRSPFIVAGIIDDEDYAKAVKCLSVFATREGILPEHLVVEEILTCTCVKLSWNHLVHYPAVVNWLLFNKIPVQINIKFGIRLTPDEFFRLELLDAKLGETYMKYSEDVLKVQLRTRIGRSLQSKHWWISDEGKKFYSWMMEFIKKHKIPEQCSVDIDDDGDDNDLWNSPEVDEAWLALTCRRLHPEAVDLEPQKPREPTKPAEDPTDHEDLCLVCFSNPPQTLVLPCGHCVVCKGCSDKLAKSDSAYNLKCIQCTQPITTILTDA